MDLLELLISNRCDKDPDCSYTTDATYRTDLSIVQSLVEVGANLNEDEKEEIM